MYAVMCFQALIIALIFLSCADTRAAAPKYFLSVVTLVRDEVNIMVEFVQHYIEEGADHVFIYDDNSTDGTRESLRCIDSQYWSVYGIEDMKLNITRERLQHEAIYARMYSPQFVNAREQSEWVVEVDGDEFISSRAQPHRTLREILETDLSDCAIITAPWLLYSHGTQEKTPRNAARYALNWRWVFEAAYSVPGKQGKFRDRHKGVEGKVIVRTKHIGAIGGLHGADTGGAGADTVCIPRLDGPMSCAANLTAQEVNLYRKIKQDINRSGGKYVHAAPSNFNTEISEIEPWCPYRDRIRARHSPIFVLMHEADVDHMQLLTFHYRVKSMDDFERKSGHDGRKRQFVGEYFLNKQEQINRMDKIDDFMTSVRKPARLNHPDFIKAQKAVASCPAEYFSVSGQIEGSGAEPAGSTDANGFRWHV